MGACSRPVCGWNVAVMLARALYGARARSLCLCSRFSGARVVWKPSPQCEPSLRPVTTQCVHNMDKMDYSAPPFFLSTADALRKGARMVFAFAILSKQHRPYRNKCFALALLALLVPRSSAMAITAPHDDNGTGAHWAVSAPSLPPPLSPLMAPPPLLCNVMPCTEANDNEAPGSDSMQLVPSHRRGLQTCTETCNFASDGLCDDGGPGAERPHPPPVSVSLQPLLNHPHRRR